MQQKTKKMTSIMRELKEILKIKMRSRSLTMLVFPTKSTMLTWKKLKMKRDYHKRKNALCIANVNFT
mgnify:FL=1